MTKWKNLIASCVCLASLGNTAFAQATDASLLYSKDACLSVEKREIQLESYQYASEEGYYVQGDTSVVETLVNHLSADAQIQISPGDQDVWVYLQYFTDVDGDGNYEWLATDEGMPLWDSVNPGGYTQEPVALSPGSPLLLTAGELYLKGVEAEISRSQGQSHCLGGKKFENKGDMLFCLTLSPQEAQLENYTDVSSAPSYYFSLDALGVQYVETLGASAFMDVSPLAWYYDAVDFVLREGYCTGISNKMFWPEAEMTRAMALQMLYQFAGSPETQPRELANVTQEHWYYNAVCWAMDNRICSGLHYDPTEAVTREELVFYLYGVAKQLEVYGSTISKRADLTGFQDGADMDYSSNFSMSWAVANNLISGDNKGNLNPQGVANRAVASLLMKNFVELAGV